MPSALLWHALTIFQRPITGMPHDILASISLVLKNSLYLCCHNTSSLSQPRDVYSRRLRHAKDKFFCAELSSVCWTKYHYPWEWKSPWGLQDIKQLQEFPQFSTTSLVTPLRHRLKEESFFTYPLAMVTTCQQLKSSFTSASPLVSPTPTYS